MVIKDDASTKSLDSVGTTAALLQALPYFARYVGKTIVVKIGGSIGQDGTALEDVVTLAKMGVRPVVVHGGGPMISEWQGRMGLEPRFVDGRRYTDEMTLDLARDGADRQGEQRLDRPPGVAWCKSGRALGHRWRAD